MGAPRSETVIPGEDAMYHCMARCVRGAFLCGFDALTGKNFDYRKVWIHERIKFLLNFFTIEVFAFALMSNHMHLLMRTLYQTLEKLSDEEIARRWLCLSPKRQAKDGTRSEPSQDEMNVILRNPIALAEVRKRLGSISWFMRLLDEYIARRSNKEEGCKGHFWDGRFKCQRIDDEAAALNCAMYIDLNPIRAMIADTPEASLFTSVWERIGAHEARKVLGSEVVEQLEQQQVAELLQLSKRDAWLAPFGQGRDGGEGFVSLQFEEYLELLDWTGRQLRPDKRGKIPDHLAPILERLRINPDGWLEASRSFGRWFSRYAADAVSMESAAKAVGKRWFKGIRAARNLFLPPVTD